MLHAHSDADAIERLFRQDPDRAHPVGARGLRIARRACASCSRKHKHLWADLAFRSDHGAGGKVAADWRPVVPRVLRSLHGRHRHLRARALVLRAGARDVVPRPGSPICLPMSPSASPGRTARPCSVARSASVPDRRRALRIIARSGLVALAVGRAGLRRPPRRPRPLGASEAAPPARRPRASRRQGGSSPPTWSCCSARCRPPS